MKFLTIIGNAISEAVSIVTSAGAGDAGKIPELDGTGRLSSTVMPVGIGADTKSIVTSENLAAGNVVNVFDNAGTPTARRADATAVGKEAVGFVLAATTSPAAALVYFEGSITGLSGLTVGAEYFVSTTAGTVTPTAPAATGNRMQSVGRAISTTEISFEPHIAVTRV
jgi:hypothetical protein